MNAWELKKKISWYEGRNRFSQEEQRQLNLDSYNFAIDHVYEATAELYGMGPKRFNEAGETLGRIEHLELVSHADKFSLFNVYPHYKKHLAQQMVQGAYKLGVEHARKSIEYAYRLGEARLARIDKKLLELQQADLGEANRTKSTYEARLLRDARRAKSPSKKGAVLDES
jgi:hypothetical protein